MYFMCISVLRACLFVYHVHTWYLRRPEKGIGLSVTVLPGVISQHILLGYMLGVRVLCNQSKCS